MSRLRDLQIEWNALVPAAQERGLRGVREVRLYPQGLHERIPHRQARLDWLRRELGMSTTIVSAPVVVADMFASLTFGVELEFKHPRHNRYAIAEAIQQAGINISAEGYNHRTSEHWKITTDASLGSDHSVNSEIVSPVLKGEEGLAAVTIVCRVLKSMGCRVSKKCGFHVHVGARNEGIGFFKTLVRLYHRADKVIDSVLAPSRRGNANSFCKPIQLNHTLLEAAASIDAVAIATGQDPGPLNRRSNKRYRKLNLQSFWQHGTVEFRHHQGTMEAEKIVNWVKFCMRMCLAARRGIAVPESFTLETLLKTLEANEHETRYFTGRQSFFARADGRAI